jgi:hypothetical protein
LQETISKETSEIHQTAVPSETPLDSTQRELSSVLNWLSLILSMSWTLLSVALSFISILFFTFVTTLGVGPLVPVVMFYLVNYAPFLIPSFTQMIDFLG